ncbi:hypothetical protein MP228_009913 [Amoeboaphelidium protococcarum]|nr:hypothetical protein MP228_009913 [Amoeboaphelidium protococcarum]
MFNKQSGTLRQKSQRQIVKQFLESPFSYKWSFMNEQDEFIMMEEICRLLQPVGEYRRTMKQQRKQQASDQPVIIAEKPAVMERLIFGINAITKHLERVIHDDKLGGKVPILAIFVCYADIQPQHLFDHLPTLCHFQGNVFLVPLRQGSEQKIAQACGFRRLAAFAVDVNIDNDLLRQQLKQYGTTVTIPYLKSEPALLQKRVIDVDVTRKDMREPRSKKQKLQQGKVVAE